jgi:hypothetical protein
MPQSFNSLKTLSQSKERFLILMGLMMALLVLGPILEQFVTIRKLIDVFLTAIILSMLYTITSKKRVFYYAWSLAIIMLLSLWLKYFVGYDLFARISMVVGALFTIVVTSLTVQFIVQSKTVTREVVYAAMLVYLLLAQLWAMVYTFLHRINPASFNLPGGQGDFLIFEYYSFVTLTTLGYGDITPLTKVAKAFAVLEAVVGQLYLVVVVAWFVGMLVARKSGNSSNQ